MKPESPLLNADRLRKLGVVVGVTLAHLGIFAVMGRADAPVPAPEQRPAVSVFLYRPPPPPPAPPPVKPARTEGGGAPAAPSRVHVPLKPAPRPPEVIAPPIPAPEPALVVGAAPVAGPTPGMGQGGEGTGTGTGRGAGSGPGSGGTRARLVRGPDSAQIARVYPRAALSARQGGRGVITCEVRLDTRLENCRLVSETPPGQGFGQAALAAAGDFRFQPPTRDGRPLGGQEITVGVDFDPGRARR